ncbi:2-keto-4-pentenoate hydratase [Kaistia hirudinis]|uniref:2-keto-4-pentenoate hydratase n=1 Tax=Kaistia hirudinis TaxID=1293440 RepID=A0A840AS76_9HYPH|nr:fumarylacetoacetate hydrolase family protein [Kaistia hirudinis]MBB3931325.1 2-keto-4-pentenoate hydratase [Kaistia hirudinis]
MVNGRVEHEDAAAATLAAARLARAAVAVLPEGLRAADLDAAYRIQSRVHERLSADRFGPRIGWKIGCTTPVMQAYLGIPEPCAAGLFAGTRHRSGVRLRAGDFRRIGIECEIGVRFKAAVPTEAAGDRDAIAAAIGAVFTAIEIVDDRYEDWRSTDTPTLIADDFFAAGCVLGAEVPFDDIGDLAALAGVTRINGAEAGRGVGADVLGHPLNALAFLAGNLGARGRRIEEGEIVLTGSLVETRWLAAGDRAEIEITGLGAVSLVVDA